MAEETGIRRTPRTFQPTFWTEVLRAKDTDAPGRQFALQSLIEAYWQLVYRFVRRKGNTIEESKDITQGFFTAFLERDFLQYVDRGRDRFRTFLLIALDHYMVDLHRKAQAQKRGGGRAVLSLDFGQAETTLAPEPASELTPERCFEREWAMRVLGRALEELRQEFSESNREEVFRAFRQHFATTGGTPPSHAELAEKLGMTEASIKSQLHRARKRYREFIRAEIRAYTENESAIEEELLELFSAFS